MTSSSVFVYGTLKPGERNFKVAESGGKFSWEEATITGHDIYHLDPENYPAVIPGSGTVHGYIYTYEDMTAALPFLDELEGTSFTPPLYNRVLVTTQPQGKEVWVYIYGNTDRCFLPTATKVESGVWKPIASEDGLYP